MPEPAFERCHLNQVSEPAFDRCRLNQVSEPAFDPCRLSLPFNLRRLIPAAGEKKQAPRAQPAGNSSGSYAFPNIYLLHYLGLCYIIILEFSLYIKQFFLPAAGGSKFSSILVYFVLSRPRLPESGSRSAKLPQGSGLVQTCPGAGTALPGPGLPPDQAARSSTGNAGYRRGTGFPGQQPARPGKTPDTKLFFKK